MYKSVSAFLDVCVCFLACVCVCMHVCSVLYVCVCSMCVSFYIICICSLVAMQAGVRNVSIILHRGVVLLVAEEFDAVKGLGVISISKEVGFLGLYKVGVL